MIYHNDYKGLSDLQFTVNQTVRNLRKHITEFDSIVVRGNSGVLVGAPVALRLKVPIVVVRKPGERSHDATKVLNWQNLGERWVFLDDFISSGATLRACKTAITKVTAPSGRTVPEHVANYQYSPYHLGWSFTDIERQRETWSKR